MRISINGEPGDPKGAQTVAELLERYEMTPESILVEHNGTALHRREWPERTLTDGDRIEIIRVVAGG